MWIRTADYALAVAGMLGHLTLLTVLVRRRLLSRVPIFAVLIAFYFLRSVILMLSPSSRAWPRWYWALIYLDPGLQLLLMLVLGLAAWRLARGPVTVAIPVMVIIASFVAWHVGSSRYSPQNLALKLSMFVSALWLLVAFLVWLLRRGDPSTKQFSFAIAAGFAAYSAANIATEIVHMHFALHARGALLQGFSFMPAIVYLGCLAGWSTAFLRMS